VERSTIHDDIQGTPIWPSLYDGRAIMGDSYHDHEAGLSMAENIKKYQDAKQSGDVSRSITWWFVARLRRTPYRRSCC